MYVDFRNIIESRHLIFAERSVLNLALFKSHLFAQCRADSHDECSLDLFEQVIRIHYRPTFIRLRDTTDQNLVLLAIDFHFRASRNIRTFFGSAGESNTNSWRFLFHTLVPMEPFCRGFEDGPEPIARAALVLFCAEMSD